MRQLSSAALASLRITRPWHGDMLRWREGGVEASPRLVW